MECVFTHHESMTYFSPEVATDVCCVEVLLHCVLLASGILDQTAGVQKPHNNFRIHRRWCDMALLLPTRGAEGGLGCRCVAVLFVAVVVKCDQSLRLCAGLLQ